MTIYSLDLKTCFVVEHTPSAYVILADKIGMRSFILLHRDSEFNIIINCVSRLRIADWSGQGRDLYFGPCLYEEDREMPQITEDEFNQHLKKYEFNIDIKQFLDDNE